MTPSLMPRATLVAMGDTLEATALRAVLECVGYEIRLIRVTTPEHAGPALGRASEDELIVLSAAGGKRGLYLGASGSSDSDWLSAEAAFEGVTFSDSTVLISTASGTRENGLARAMMGAGGRLIAPNGYPEARVVVPWIAACLLASERGIEEAVASANALVAVSNQFSYA